MYLEVKVRAFSDFNTMIEYQAFTPEGAKEGKQTTRSGEDHGAIVASAVVRQYRLLDPKSPIEVYSANPFGLTKNAAGKSFLKLDFKQAEKALEWMHSKGVRTVVTDRKSVVEGKGGTVRVALGSRRIFKKKKQKTSDI